MRVAYVSHVARLSGAEIGLLRFLRAADRIDATVLLAEDGDLVDPLREAGARVEVLPMTERARSLKRAQVRPGANQAMAAADVARYVVALRRRLRRLQPDLVHTNSLKAGVYGTAAARAAGIPTVWHLHDRLAADYLPRAAVRPMRALAATTPSALVVPSRYTLDAVGKRFRPGMPAEAIPFPIPRAQRPQPAAAEVRTVGIVGRLTPWKGQHVFLDAFAQAFPDGETRARVIGNAMFGETDYEAELHRQAASLGIAERVDFAGFRPDISAELATLDVLVHASVLADPLTTVVLEGMAHGLPVVSADAGGHAEHVTDGRDGLLFAPGDSTALAGRLTALADDSALRERIAVGGYATSAEFAPDAVVERMEDLYRRVLRR